MTFSLTDSELERRLREHAAERGISPDDAAHSILAQALGAPIPGNLADFIAGLVDPLGGVRLDTPPRVQYRDPPFAEVLWDDDLGEDDREP